MPDLHDSLVGTDTTHHTPHAEGLWLYYRIHLGSRALIDSFLGGHLSSLLADITCDSGPVPWFYLRSIDEFGMHLRLRVRVPTARASTVDRLVETRVQTFLALTARNPARPVGHLGFSRCPYAPEGHKYGGPAGVRRAERLFQTGSETALTLVPYTAAQRLHAARTHLSGLTASLPATQRVAFLHQYAWYWSHGPQGRAPGYAARLDALLRGQPPVPPAHPEPVRAALDAYVQQCRALVEEAAAAQPRTSLSYLLFQHIHLMHNRLGVTPLEEALTARALWHAATATKDSP
ncbi:hypothetical protein Sros01_68310 [Streptomyces roseochromogenus]|nr:hypothetical protein Sros01_68310 [Streptomyces roseochromogenus]